MSAARVLSVMWIGWSLASWSGCARESEAMRHSVLVRVTTDEAWSVGGARVELAGTVRGETDKQGNLTVVVNAARNQHLHVRVRCPVGFRDGSVDFDVALREVRDLSGRVRPLVVDAQCVPLERDGVLVVRARAADGARLPVRVNGAVVAQLDDQGLAHVPLTWAPHGELRVMLDTTQAPRLRPSSPTQSYVVSDRAGILVFDQLFEMAKPRRVAKVKPMRPYRVEADTGRHSRKRLTSS